MSDWFTVDIETMPVMDDDIMRAVERMIISADGRGTEIIKMGIEQRFCLDCMSITWFVLSHERNGIGYETLYKTCVGGRHAGMSERLNYKNR